jgi:hypothetical protein
VSEPEAVAVHLEDMDVMHAADQTNILVGWTIYNVAKVTRFLCASCGFIEHWVESADDLATVKMKYRS